jgi:hypothetical protein
MQAQQLADGFGLYPSALALWDEVIARSDRIVCLFRDNEPVGAAATTLRMPGVMFAWALLTEKIAPAGMVIATKAIREATNELLSNGCRRVETTARVGFPQAHRWLLMLGFEAEGTMRRFAEDGADHIMYSRVS